MQWILSDESPIHNQLVEELKHRIFLGFYRSGEKFPSVRDLAAEAKVNPNTMQKALGELESDGLIYTKKTSGRYVADSKFTIQQAKQEMEIDLINEFISNIQKLGIDSNTVINSIKKRLDE